MAPSMRKFVLVTHVTASVGWLGAVIGSMALAVIALTSQDAQVVRAVYLLLELTGWFVLVPLSLASLLTGLVQSLAGAWGLLDHYWVLAKLLMNLFATGVLLLYMQTLTYFAGVVADPNLSSSDLLGMRDPSPIVHAAAAFLLLLVATTLSVYKPRGMTRHGQRKQQRSRAASPVS
jgi:hypothetical protein